MKYLICAEPISPHQKTSAQSVRYWKDQEH